MIELLVMYVVSIIASFTIDVAILFKIYKISVDNGYKINFERFTEVVKIETFNSIMLIPIVNVAISLCRTMQYISKGQFMLDELRVFDALIPMTKEEQKEYKKEPTLLNALRVINDQYMENDAIKIIYVEGNEKSVICYNIKDGIRRIIKVEGPLSKLSIFEQQIKLNEILEDDTINFIESLEKGNHTLILTKTDRNIEEESISTPNESTLQNRKEQLKQLRDDLISQKESIQQESEEEVKTYKKEMK